MQNVKSLVRVAQIGSDLAPAYKHLILQIVPQLFFFFMNILCVILEIIDLIHCYKLNDILI